MTPLSSDHQEGFEGSEFKMGSEAIQGGDADFVASFQVTYRDGADPGSPGKLFLRETQFNPSSAKQKGTLGRSG